MGNLSCCLVEILDGLTHCMNRKLTNHKSKPPCAGSIQNWHKANEIDGAAHKLQFFTIFVFTLCVIIGHRVQLW